MESRLHSRRTYAEVFGAVSRKVLCSRHLTAHGPYCTVLKQATRHTACGILDLHLPASLEKYCII